MSDVTAEEIPLVVNPRAGAGKASKRLPRLLRSLRAAGTNPIVHHTRHPGHATELVRRLLSDGAAGVAVVGGDGTVNEAVNGFFDEAGEPVSPGAWLGPLPCGTGGDFRKTAGIPESPEAMAERLVGSEPKPIDVGWITFVDHDGDDAHRAFLNVASFGIGGLVDRLVNESPKWMGGRTAFFVGSLRALTQYRNRLVRFQVDGQDPREARVINVAIANGQYFGGGMHIAPEAALDDGLFDVVSLERQGIAEQLTLTKPLYDGTLLRQSGVEFTRGTTIHAEPLEGLPVELDVDGEAPGRLPATFELRSGVLRLR
ncbi:MAG: YegS/Rv2252/BmrU family lipid kinase [Deltaproteobacteria bacterium]|nr:YegS/Rv2252/BmrU family lipid kinase [Deltaproteobacteria bacterium]